ncbi:MAG: DUF3494 domain-containing protein [Bacteroidia bacterium]|nr:DUF3494 domain-containing protein [Bacteroidia bacterium]
MKTQLDLFNKAIGSMYEMIGYKKKQNKLLPSRTTPILIPFQITKQLSVILNTASGYAILAGSAVRNTGKTVITGNLGLSPGTSVGGFPSGILIGSEHINDESANQAKNDLSTAYYDAAGRMTEDLVKLSGNIGGLTLTPGLYKSLSSIALSSGDLILDAKGNTDAVFIIQIATTLIVRIGRKVILAGGALASNIFWQVGGSATFETNSVFNGSVLSMHSITLNTGAKLNGKIFAINGAVVLAGNTIVKQ